MKKIIISYTTDSDTRFQVKPLAICLLEELAHWYRAHKHHSRLKRQIRRNLQSVGLKLRKSQKNLSLKESSSASCRVKNPKTKKIASRLKRERSGMTSLIVPSSTREGGKEIFPDRRRGSWLILNISSTSFFTRYTAAPFLAMVRPREPYSVKKDFSHD